MQLLISGADQGEAGTRGVKALLLVLDTASGEIVHSTEYVTPEWLYEPGHKIRFTGFSRQGSALFVCTHNHIVVFDDWPPTRPCHVVTHPGFNDLHHCIPYEDGLLVANTGLETIDFVSMDGKLQDRIDLLAGIPDARRIDDNADYRRLADTKPHKVHVNHLFFWGSRLWATLLGRWGAVDARDGEQAIDLVVGMPHDGIPTERGIVFTTTNGHVVRAEYDGERWSTTPYSLVEMTPELNQLGWCRGVQPLDRNGEQVFVAFTAIRRSAWTNYGYFIKHHHHLPPSRVCLYDLQEHSLQRTWYLGPRPGYLLFQILALPEADWI